MHRNFIISKIFKRDPMFFLTCGWRGKCMFLRRLATDVPHQSSKAWRLALPKIFSKNKGNEDTCEKRSARIIAAFWGLGCHMASPYCLLTLHTIILTSLRWGDLLLCSSRLAEAGENNRVSTMLKYSTSTWKQTHYIFCQLIKFYTQSDARGNPKCFICIDLSKGSVLWQQ